MEARASFGGTQVAAGVLRVFVLALVVALLVGGAGGYIVRALTFSASTTVVTDTHHPFVVERAPYSSPPSTPTSEPIYDPNGNPIIP